MKVSIFFIYMVIVGWTGVFLSIIGPLAIMYLPEQQYATATEYGPISFLGPLMSLAAGIIILVKKRHKFRQMAILFILVGGGALLYFLISDFIYGNTPGPNSLENT